MEILDKTGLLQKLVQKIRSNGIGGLTRAADVREFLQELINTMFAKFGESSTANQGLEWSAGTTYDTTTKPFAVYMLRIFKSKVDDNLGNEPPAVPDESGNYENEFWIEVSPSPSSGIVSWKAGIFDGGLKIVEHGDRLLKLSGTVSRPFESTDITTELAAGKWVDLGADEGGGASEIIERIPTLHTISAGTNTLNLSQRSTTGTTHTRCRDRLEFDARSGATFTLYFSSMSEGQEKFIEIINNGSTAFALNFPIGSNYEGSGIVKQSNTIADSLTETWEMHVIYSNGKYIVSGGKRKRL